MPRRGDQNAEKAERIKALLRDGHKPRDIAIENGFALSYVYDIRARMRAEAERKEAERREEERPKFEAYQLVLQWHRTFPDDARYVLALALGAVLDSLASESPDLEPEASDLMGLQRLRLDALVSGRIAPPALSDLPPHVRQLLQVLAGSPVEGDGAELPNPLRAVVRAQRTAE